VKIIDDDPFPSTRFREELQTVDGTDSIIGPELWWEYFKLNFCERGMAWRSVLIVVLDQMANVYLCFKLAVSIYMVDVLFQKPWKDTEPYLVLTDDRREACYVISALYIVPLLVLHIWAICKIKLDVDGRSRTWLQRCLFRKYLNYSDASRMKVKFSDIELAITSDVADVAEGYTVVLDGACVVGKLLVLGMFVYHQNRRAL
jgi:hypothetical protein